MFEEADASALPTKLAQAQFNEEACEKEGGAGGAEAAAPAESASPAPPKLSKRRKVIVTDEDVLAAEQDVRPRQ